MNSEQLVEQAKRYHKRSCELAWKAEDYWNEHVRVNGTLDDADYQEYRRLADESEDLCAKSNCLFDQAIKLRDPHETAESDADTEADMFATTPASEKLVIDASERMVVMPWDQYTDDLARAQRMAFEDAADVVRGFRNEIKVMLDTAIVRIQRRMDMMELMR